MNTMNHREGIVRNKIWHLSPGEALEHCKKQAILVDVREGYMNHFKMFDVPRIIYMPFTEFEEKYTELPFEKLLIFADAAGLNSKKAATLMLDKGYRNIANVAGGLVEWERAGLPLRIDKSNRLTGSCMCQLKPREK